MAKGAVLRQMNDEELARHLAETREEMFHLRFQLAMGKQDNSARLGQVRRDVARALTLKRERELASAPAAGEKKARRAKATRSRSRKVRA